ncbi:MAG TPA: hypothetical protein VE439_04295, partial [Anaerolineae bacterium]|nr:hypothetical protein [Anaerolineae bacterium]
MATSERRYGAADIDLARAKRYVRSSGSGSAPKPHRGNAYSSVRNIEIDSGGLYRFEKMVRMAFVQVMKEDVVFGQKDSIIAYIAGLSNDFEGPVVSDIDWQPDQSSAMMSEFMM